MKTHIQTVNRLQQIQKLSFLPMLRLLNPHISPPFPNLSTGWRSTNASNIIFCLSRTKFLQPRNLAIFTTSSLFNPIAIAVPAPHLLSLFLARQPSPLKSQIAQLGMHHLVVGINFRFISSDSPTHPLVNSSFSSSPLSSSIIPSLFHSRLKTYLSTNPSHLRLLLPTGLPSW